jgi:hypothetical protein
MTNIVVRIMVELLSVLALATKQVTQGRFTSKCAVTHTFFAAQYVREEAIGGQRDRGCALAIGLIGQGRGPDDCRADIGCGPRSCGQYELVTEGAESGHNRSQIFF